MLNSPHWGFELKLTVLSADFEKKGKLGGRARLLKLKTNISVIWYFTYSIF